MGATLRSLRGNYVSRMMLSRTTCRQTSEMGDTWHSFEGTFDRLISVLISRTKGRRERFRKIYGVVDLLTITGFFAIGRGLLLEQHRD